MAGSGVARENADAGWLPLSPEFEEYFAACAGRGCSGGKELRARQLRIRPVVHSERKKLSNDATKYGRDHGSAQEASSKNPIATSNDRGDRGIIPRPVFPPALSGRAYCMLCAGFVHANDLGIQAYGYSFYCRVGGVVSIIFRGQPCSRGFETEKNQEYS